MSTHERAEDILHDLQNMSEAFKAEAKMAMFCRRGDGTFSHGTESLMAHFNKYEAELAEAVRTTSPNLQQPWLRIWYNVIELKRYIFQY